MRESKNVDGSEELSALIASYRAFVTYVPLQTEVAIFDLISLPKDALIYEIAPRASLDPKTEASRALERIGTDPAFMFIPGRRFDVTGTRHGQGGGWYDRFLTFVPREWLRVGVCFEEQLSQEPLRREAWDQAMDVVCVVQKESNRISRIITI